MTRIIAIALLLLLLVGCSGGNLVWIDQDVSLKSIEHETYRVKCYVWVTPWTLFGGHIEWSDYRDDVKCADIQRVKAEQLEAAKVAKAMTQRRLRGWQPCEQR